MYYTIFPEKISFVNDFKAGSVNFGYSVYEVCMTDIYTAYGKFKNGRFSQLDKWKEYKQCAS